MTFKFSPLSSMKPVQGVLFPLFLVKYKLNYASWFKELCRGSNCTSGRYLWAPLSEGGGIVTWSHYGIQSTGLEFWSPNSQPGVCSKNNLHEVASVLWCGIHLLAVSVKEGFVYFFHWLASSCWNIALVKIRFWEVTAMCQMSRSYSSRSFVWPQIISVHKSGGIGYWGVLV